MTQKITRFKEYSLGELRYNHHNYMYGLQQKKKHKGERELFVDFNSICDEDPFQSIEFRSEWDLIYYEFTNFKVNEKDYFLSYVLNFVDKFKPNLLSMEVLDDRFASWAIALRNFVQSDEIGIDISMH